MEARLELLTAGLRKHPGASQETIDAAQVALGVTFPPDYVEFMLTSDGAAGPVGENGYISLWPVEKLVERNAGYAVAEFAPGLVLFGSDGGGTAYAFDARATPLVYVDVPFIPLALSEVRACGPSLAEFLETIGK